MVLVLSSSLPFSIWRVLVFRVLAQGELGPADIGVVTPYMAQVRLLRRSIRETGAVAMSQSRLVSSVCCSATRWGSSQCHGDQHMLIGVRGSLSRSISAPAHDERGGCPNWASSAVSGRAGGDIVFLLIWSQKRDWDVLGPPREAEIRYASIWIGGEAWRGRQRSIFKEKYDLGVIFEGACPKKKVIF